MLDKMKRNSSTNARGFARKDEVPGQNQGVKALEGKLKVYFRSIDISLLGALRGVLRTRVQRGSVS